MKHKTFNEWFLSLPEGEQAVIREDKWRLADNAFQAGKEASKDDVVEELLKVALEYAEFGDGDTLIELSDVAIKYAKHKGERLMTAEHFVALVAANMNNYNLLDREFRDILKDSINLVHIEDKKWKEFIDKKIKEKS